MSMNSYANWGHFIELNDENMNKLGCGEEFRSLVQILDENNIELSSLGDDDLSEQTYHLDNSLACEICKIHDKFERAFEVHTGLKIETENYFHLGDDDEGQDSLERDKVYLRFNQSDLYDITPNKSLLALKAFKVEPIFDSYTNFS